MGRFRNAWCALTAKSSAAACGRGWADLHCHNRDAATEGAVRAVMQDVVEGRTADAVVRRLLDRADYEVRRAAGEGHYHAGCDCRIVPGFEGAKSRVEGYDPGLYLDMWWNPERYAKGGSGAEDPVLKRYSKIAESGSRHSAISEANRLEQYEADNRKYTENCQRCVVAAELRRRGYDVVAKPRILRGEDEAASNWKDLFLDADWRKARSRSDADRQISSMPKGARGTVYIVWEGERSAHVFNFENTPNGVVYYDCQSGEADASAHFARKSPKYDLLIARTDNLKVNPRFIDAVVENRV